MTSELLDLFDEAKRIIDKQEQLIKMQQSLIVLVVSFLFPFSFCPRCFLIVMW